MPKLRELMQRFRPGEREPASEVRGKHLLHKADGSPRRLGVEIEFSGLSLPRICALLPRCVGGHAEVVSDYEAHVRDTEWGDFTIELDFAFLKAMGRESAEGGESRGGFERLSEELLAVAAKQVVPFEVVTPPIPMDQLDIVDRICDALREAGAKGTRHSPLYAFGVHMNVELPATDADTLGRYLRAYALLADWLRERCHPDFSRRLSPYIEPWPGDYIRHLLQPDQTPDQRQILDDYLRFNPTRNRAMDLLPLLAQLDEARVRAVVDDDRIKPRPALHYRLPNCQIDEPDWRWRQLWEDWLEVEWLANDPQRLLHMADAFRDFHGSVVDRVLGNWVDEVRPWLQRDEGQ